MDETGWAGQLLLVGLGTARFAAAFAFLPLFSPDTIPATVRNSIFVAFGLITLSLLPELDTAAFGPRAWIALYLKEIFVGLTIGLFFGSILWALSAAGEIIDTKVGSNMAQVIDPLTGHQTSLNAALLGRLANVLFVSAGGLVLLVGAVLESHAIWPMGSGWPNLGRQSVQVFQMEFGRLLSLAVLVAAPILVVLFLIDLGLGLVNRFAQQLNVFSLSLSIKSFSATFLLILIMPAVAVAVVADIAARGEIVRSLLSAMAR